jgi:hypothetical protein
MTAAHLIGTTCTLTYRWLGDGPAPNVGNFLETKAGSAYEIMEARSIGGDRNKLKLTCIRIDPSQIPIGVQVYSLVWDRRKPTRKR